MSAITYLTSIVTSLTNRFNSLESNSKKVDELPAQTTLEPSSKIPVSRAGVSEYITAQQIISSIQNSNYNQLTSIGAITIDGTDLIVEPVSGQINGSLYATTTNTTIPIVLCDTSFSRKDIVVLTTSNTVVVISGEETDGSIVIAPNTPLDAIYITEFDVSDSVIGVPTDPITGTQFKQKIENTRWKSTQSGTDVVIPFQAAGQMHYSVVNSGLISVAGFSTANLTGPLYEGVDVLFENQTGNAITLKNMFGGILTPVKFNFGADLIVPNAGKLWMRVRNREFELIMKSWIDIDLSTKADLVGGKVRAEQLPSYVDDVLEFANLAAFPATGESGKIYVALDTNKTYRWSGSAYVQIGSGGGTAKIIGLVNNASIVLSSAQAGGANTIMHSFVIPGNEISNSLIEVDYFIVRTLGTTNPTLNFNLYISNSNSLINGANVLVRSINANITGNQSRGSFYSEDNKVYTTAENNSGSGSYTPISIDFTQPVYFHFYINNSGAISADSTRYFRHINVKAIKSI